VKPSVTITMATSIRRSTGLRDDRTVPPLRKETSCPKQWNLSSQTKRLAPCFSFVAAIVEVVRLYLPSSRRHTWM
jgi:hypothetical protein